MTNPEHEFERTITQLKNGQWEAWKGLRERWHRGGTNKPAFAGSIEGKEHLEWVDPEEQCSGRICVFADDGGFGDVFMFIRCMALLKAQGFEHVSIVVKKPLVPLCQFAKHYIDEIIVSGTKDIACDRWTTLITLPGMLGIFQEEEDLSGAWSFMLPQEIVKKWEAVWEEETRKNPGKKLVVLNGTVGTQYPTLAAKAITGERAVPPQEFAPMVGDSRLRCYALDDSIPGAFHCRVWLEEILIKPQGHSLIQKVLFQ